MNERKYTLGVIGLGVVGSTVRDHAAERGFDVVFNDPFVMGSRPLSDVANRDYVFITVPTPGMTDRALDASIVLEVATALAKAPSHMTALIIKSTVPPGMFARLRALHPDLPLCYVPEFLREKSRRSDFAHPDRTVIASDDLGVRDAVAKLYSTLVDDPRIVFAAPDVAEIAKLASNAFLALKVTFANELFDATRAHGIDWSQVADLVGMDSRIGRSHLDVTPERGFDGPCLPKDSGALATWVKEGAGAATLLEGMLTVNRRVRSSP